MDKGDYLMDLISGAGGTAAPKTKTKTKKADPAKDAKK